MKPSYYKISESLGKALLFGKLKLVTAESCSGGGLGHAITSVPGSSAWFEYGFISYSNAAKSELLGVKPTTLESFGSVSEPTVREMLIGALKISKADIGMAISGIAGPEGGTKHKPVGTVCIAWGSPQYIQANTYVFAGDRDDVREASIRQSLQLATRFIREQTLSTTR